MLAPEIRPQHGRDVELRIGQLPQHEVADALLTGGTDQQVGIGDPAGVQLTREGSFIDVSELLPEAYQRTRVLRSPSLQLAKFSMLARTGGMNLPPPGGDVIGRRRVDTHFLAFQKLGASFEHDAESFRAVTVIVRVA